MSGKASWRSWGLSEGLRDEQGLAGSGKKGCPGQREGVRDCLRQDGTRRGGEIED